MFTTSPLSLSSVIGWVPLGAMEPPGHTFPTDHQYLYYANPGGPGNTTLNVLAPAHARIWMIYQDTGICNEYSIWIQPCAQIIGRLGSLAGLSSDLPAAAGAIDRNCQTSSGSTQCQKSLTYAVSAGQVIGTINSSTENALDWWLWDSRVTPIAFVDPAPFQRGPYTGFTEADIVPASAYYTTALTPQIAAKLGTSTARRCARAHPWTARSPSTSRTRRAATGSIRLSPSRPRRIRRRSRRTTSFPPRRKSSRSASHRRT